MSSKIIVAAAILSLVSGQNLNGFARSASSLAEDLASVINTFDGSSASVTSIQSSFLPFSSYVASMEVAASRARPGDITNSRAIGNTLKAIADLLDAFTAKFNEYNKLIAIHYPQKNIGDLAKRSEDIVTELVGILNKEQIYSLAPAVSTLSDAFRSAGYRYGVARPRFPDLRNAADASPAVSRTRPAIASSAALPATSSGTASSVNFSSADFSSAAAPSTASLDASSDALTSATDFSVADSSVPPSSAAASSAGTPTSSTASSATSSTSSLAAASSSASSTRPEASASLSASQSSASSSANGVAAFHAGLAAAAAGAVALLI